MRRSQATLRATGEQSHNAGYDDRTPPVQSVRIGIYFAVLQVPHSTIPSPNVRRVRLAVRVVVEQERASDWNSSHFAASYHSIPSKMPSVPRYLSADIFPELAPTTLTCYPIAGARIIRLM